MHKYCSFARFSGTLATVITRKMSIVAKYIDKKGAFVRKDAKFMNKITADGSSGFKAESGRYHVYVSYACPWAHRVLIVRNLKGLCKVISVTVVDWLLTEKGWSFTDQKPKCSLEPFYNCQYLRELYFKADPDYDAAYTVPMLWDKHKETVVCNESSEIIRMLNTEFNEFCETPEQKELNLYPESLRPQIDDVNKWIYPNINNGVYRSGFAKSQEAYDEAVTELFASLERVEEILSKQRFLAGSTFTEADVRLFTTLIRFDWVYHGHFKCNKKKLTEFPNIWAFTRDIYQMPGVAETVDKEHITKHYMVSHKSINPTGIVSVGPDLDLMAPANRDKMQQLL